MRTAQISALGDSRSEIAFGRIGGHGCRDSACKNHATRSRCSRREYGNCCSSEGYYGPTTVQLTIPEYDHELSYIVVVAKFSVVVTVPNPRNDWQKGVAAPGSAEKPSLKSSGVQVKTTGVGHSGVGEMVPWYAVVELLALA